MKIFSERQIKRSHEHRNWFYIPVQMQSVDGWCLVHFYQASTTLICKMTGNHELKQWPKKEKTTEILTWINIAPKSHTPVLKAQLGPSIGNNKLIWSFSRTFIFRSKSCQGEIHFRNMATWFHGRLLGNRKIMLRSAVRRRKYKFSSRV